MPAIPKVEMLTAWLRSGGEAVGAKLAAAMAV
jgi:hypothetical protein